MPFLRFEIVKNVIVEKQGDQGGPLIPDGATPSLMQDGEVNWWKTLTDLQNCKWAMSEFLRRLYRRGYLTAEDFPDWFRKSKVLKPASRLKTAYRIVDEAGNDINFHLKTLPKVSDVLVHKLKQRMRLKLEDDRGKGAQDPGSEAFQHVLHTVQRDTFHYAPESEYKYYDDDDDEEDEIVDMGDRSWTSPWEHIPVPVPKVHRGRRKQSAAPFRDEKFKDGEVHYLSEEEDDIFRDVEVHDLSGSDDEELDDISEKEEREEGEEEDDKFRGVRVHDLSGSHDEELDDFFKEDERDDSNDEDYNDEVSPPAPKSKKRPLGNATRGIRRQRWKGGRAGGDGEGEGEGRGGAGGGGGNAEAGAAGDGDGEATETDSETERKKANKAVKRARKEAKRARKEAEEARKTGK
jgi:hypothetical protein